jgi:hypothetical protein
MVAITPRHEQVAQNHVGPMLDGQLDSLVAIDGFNDLPLRSAQGLCRRFPANLVVIDQQDRLHLGMPEDCSVVEIGKPASWRLQRKRKRNYGISSSLLFN